MWMLGWKIAALRTLQTQDTSDSGHFGTCLVGPNCPDRSALVPKCPKDSLDLSAEQSSRKCRSVLPHLWQYVGLTWSNTSWLTLTDYATRCIPPSKSNLQPHWSSIAIVLGGFCDLRWQRCGFVWLLCHALLLFSASIIVNDHWFCALNQNLRFHWQELQNHCRKWFKT